MDVNLLTVSNSKGNISIRNEFNITVSYLSDETKLVNVNITFDKISESLYIIIIKLYINIYTLYVIEMSMVHNLILVIQNSVIFEDKILLKTLNIV